VLQHLAATEYVQPTLLPDRLRLYVQHVDQTWESAIIGPAGRIPGPDDARGPGLHRLAPGSRGPGSSRSPVRRDVSTPSG